MPAIKEIDPATSAMDVLAKAVPTLSDSQLTVPTQTQAISNEALNTLVEKPTFTHAKQPATHDYTKEAVQLAQSSGPKNVPTNELSKLLKTSSSIDLVGKTVSTPSINPHVIESAVSSAASEPIVAQNQNIDKKLGA